MIDLDPRSYLHDRLARRPGHGLVVDVGAASGEFTRDLRPCRPGSPFLLVEPTPAAADALRSAFAADPLVHVAAVALSDRPGNGRLHRYADGTQNSLLPLQAGGEAEETEVEVTTLDLLLAGRPGLPAPEVIKIDTQGHDLAVLQGGLATIRRHRPLIQVEVIFADLYLGQCPPSALMALLTGEGYHLADMIAPHVDEQGRLAYADWLFTPDPPHRSPAAFACRDAALLAAQVRLFRTAAEERLALIDRLSAECAARGRIIDQLRATGAQP